MRHPSSPVVLSVLALLEIACWAAAAEPDIVSLKKLNDDPSTYKGKVVQVRAQVSGTVTEKPKFVWLTVKGKALTVEGSQVNKEGINFVVPKKDSDRLLKGLRDGEFTQGKITATVRKVTVGWLAVVSEIEIGDTSGDNTKAHVKGKGKPEASETEVVAEGAGKTKDDALKDAFRNAVRQIVGAVLDAETQVKNDEIISDNVLTYSAGIVKKYDEIGKPQEKDGLMRVKIRATVKKTELVAKLKAANVTITNVDGKGLFAEAVTGLEREKNAKILLNKKLREYRKTIVKAEVVGKPRIKSKGEAVTEIEYDIKFSADPEKYEALLEELLPILRRTASATGQVRISTAKVTWNLRHDELWPITDGVGHIGKATGVNSHSDASSRGLGPIWQSSYESVWIEENGLRRKKSNDLRLIVVCTRRTRLNDRLTWEWFLVPKTDDELCSVCMHVSVVDKHRKEITANDIPLSSFKMPGLRLLESGDQKGDLVVAPYLLQVGTSWQQWNSDRIATDVTIKVKSKVPTSELKNIQHIQCKIEVKESAKKSND